VGTLTELSGSRLGGELSGIDTPTLLGIWQTAPYLHDGSALTLRDVLTTRNAAGQHGDTANLPAEDLDALVAYLQQIDLGLPPVELSLPAGSPEGPTDDDAPPSEPATGVPPGAEPPTGAMPGAEPSTDGENELSGTAPNPSSGCGCKLWGSPRAPAGAPGWWVLVGLVAALRRYARRRAASARPGTRSEPQNPIERFSA
jgi:hypothetical protein